MKLLSLTVPGTDGTPLEIAAPSGVPTGGLEGDGGKIIGLAITWLMIASVIIALLFLIYGGANYIMSEGDKTKVESARRTILYAVIGLLVVFFSFFVINFVGAALGVNFFNLTI